MLSKFLAYKVLPSVVDNIVRRAKVYVNVGITLQLGMLISVTWSHGTKDTEVNSMSLYAVYIVCILLENQEGVQYIRCYTELT